MYIGFVQEGQQRNGTAHVVGKVFEHSSPLLLCCAVKLVIFGGYIMMEDGFIGCMVLKTPLEENITPIFKKQFPASVKIWMFFGS